MYNFDKLLDRKNTNSAKWDGMYRSYGTNDLIPMFVADMDFEVLPAISEALVKRAQHPTYGYSLIPDSYYDNIIAWNKKRNNFTFVKEELLPIPGCVSATVFAIQALTNPGDKVLLHTPAYFPFFSAIKDSGREMVTSTLTKDANQVYQMDFADMEAKMKDGVKLLIMCSPHNPCGRVWTKEELEKTVDLCHKYGVIIFCDEIHSDIILEGKHIPILALNEKAREISLIAAAPSKTFNIAGIKSSFFVIQNEELRKKVSTLMNCYHVGLDLFAVTATEVAYGQGEQWVNELIAYIKKNAEFVVDYCNKNTKIKAFVPEATFLMFLDFSAYGLSDEVLAERCIKAGIAMNKGITFGPEGTGFMRLNIGTPLSQVKKALEQLKAEFEG